MIIILIFNSLFTATAYSTDQQQAAEIYLQYLAQQYESLTNKINFSHLKTKFNSLIFKP
ncbi:hypothetical protein [Coxiella-like endosymbiont of Rhipicephalus sanguineus]|uniref:hypothetical protein n=1 Tax=Coxiella-like endosymbiont of Rhipicephalus sanguineus TaxID=1955402 RepID=UPI00203EBDB1|nr:hypothetical protein [Coxiella-like endosymbiont of Rhipicephalus sanguineus]